MVLRIPREEDIPQFRAALNDPEMARFTSRNFPAMTRQGGLKLVRNAGATRRSGELLSLMGFERDTGNLVAAVALFHFNWTDRHAEIGYWVPSPMWGQGYATEAAGAVCRAAFRWLRLHRVEAQVRPINPASARVLAHLGFVREGIRRSCRRKGKTWIGFDTFGLLEEEFRYPRPRARALRSPGRRGPVPGGTPRGRRSGDTSSGGRAGASPGPSGRARPRATPGHRARRTRPAPSRRRGT